VDFSLPYFASGQQFIARKGSLSKPEQLAGLRVGVDKGTTQEIYLREKYSKTTVVAYDDTPLAFTALRNGNVQAISQDGSKLAALLANAPDKAKYELAPFTLTREYQAIGLPKGEARLTKVVNDTLVELEKSGQARKIYDRWFGPSTKARCRVISRSATPSDFSGSQPACALRTGRFSALTPLVERRSR
jgi:polar amino acid transport system substrate-binding protein